MSLVGSEHTHPTIDTPDTRIPQTASPNAAEEANVIAEQPDVPTPSGYPKPPYRKSTQVFHKYDFPVSRKTALRAMGRDGQCYKDITQRIAGLKYVYWHQWENQLELWFANSRQQAWPQAVEMLDNRLMFTVLRPPDGGAISRDTRCV